MSALSLSSEPRHFTIHDYQVQKLVELSYCFSGILWMVDQFRPDQGMDITRDIMKPASEQLLELAEAVREQSKTQEEETAKAD